MLHKGISIATVLFSFVWSAHYRPHNQPTTGLTTSPLQASQFAMCWCWLVGCLVRQGFYARIEIMLKFLDQDISESTIIKQRYMSVQL